MKPNESKTAVICPMCERVDPVRRMDSDKCPSCDVYLLDTKDFPEITPEMKIAAIMRKEAEGSHD